MPDLHTIFDNYIYLKYISFSFIVIGIVFFVWSKNIISPKLIKTKQIISYIFFFLFFISLPIYKYISDNYLEYIKEKVLYNIALSKYIEINNKKLQDTSTVILKKHLLGQSIKKEKRSQPNPRTALDIKFRLASDEMTIQIYQDSRIESEFWVFYQKYEDSKEYEIVKINITEKVLLDDLGIK